MRSIRQARRDAKKLFRLCLEQGAMDEERVRQVVQLLCRSTNQRNRFNVLSAFLRLVELDCVRHTALVESAAALPTDIQARVQAGLSRAYGPRMNVSFNLRSGTDRGDAHQSGQRCL